MSKISPELALRPVDSSQKRINPVKITLHGSAGRHILVLKLLRLWRVKAKQPPSDIYSYSVLVASVLEEVDISQGRDLEKAPPFVYEKARHDSMNPCAWSRVDAVSQDWHVDLPMAMGSR